MSTLASVTASIEALRAQFAELNREHWLGTNYGALAAAYERRLVEIALEIHALCMTRSALLAGVLPQRFEV